MPGDHPTERTGPCWIPIAASPRLVRSSTGRVNATIVSQLPVLEIVWPMKNSRKVRDRSADSVVLATNVALVSTPAG